ncbi:MAG TPA: glycosyl transferase [Deltaproteobacteria bacterium]|nr:MAG: glycosyl transferase [Deltaproteobacteria bacterium GWA2_55_82]OGQ64612.1 MAG: glycosyl transferase [Deltaproteobacteria bacterium RIFCSPLOWO2_02_FULL_55_12]OIJ73710.1 MAG: glycosyl transferase [Deltaproteobacteria bacterium GWC2_55_46]HBG45896.1 glycosyl transferase [Deltaproteobacteria bacterium]HCY09685.1 glycosyl transferase [Deltaproteobacteria bacterium]
MGKVSILILFDLLMACLAVYTGWFIRFGTSLEASSLFGLGALFFAAVLIVSSFLCELYNLEKNAGKKEISAKVIVSMALSFFILATAYYLIPQLMIGRGVLALSLGSFAVYQFLGHLAFRISSSLPTFAKRVLILGTGPLANKMGSVMNGMSHNYVLAGYVNCTNETVLVPLHSIIGSGEGLAETVQKEKAHKIVVSLSERRGSFPLRDVLDCKLGGIEVMDAPSFYEQVTGKLLIENITPSWFIFSDGFRITHSKMLLKRVFDMFTSVAALLVALPMIPFIVLAVKADSPGPVLFRQIRVGQKGKKFALYKFRTMRNDAEAETGAVWSQENDPRVTRIGRWLRKSRLDEIPQLYNVLRGDMSLVGPRPERPEFISQLSEAIPFYTERHYVKPGITGWAQIKYPYGASVDDSLEKLRYDLFYIKHLSPLLDIFILVETAKVMLFGRGGR